jgi:hypothetical protein
MVIKLDNDGPGGERSGCDDTPTEITTGLYYIQLELAHDTCRVFGDPRGEKSNLILFQQSERRRSF